MINPTPPYAFVAFLGIPLPLQYRNVHTKLNAVTTYSAALWHVVGCNFVGFGGTGCSVLGTEDYWSNYSVARLWFMHYTGGNL